MNDTCSVQKSTRFNSGVLLQHRVGPKRGYQTSGYLGQEKTKHIIHQIVQLMLYRLFLIFEATHNGSVTAEDIHDQTRGGRFGDEKFVRLLLGAMRNNGYFRKAGQIGLTKTKSIDELRQRQ